MNKNSLIVEWQKNTIKYTLKYYIQSRMSLAYLIYLTLINYMCVYLNTRLSVFYIYTITINLIFLYIRLLVPFFEDDPKIDC